MNNDRDTFDNIADFCREHRYALALAFVGLLLAVLFIVIGFWKTLLIALLMGGGAAGGVMIDRHYARRRDDDGQDFYNT